MNLHEITVQAIDPALKLLPKKLDSERARVQLLAIGLQESEFKHRRQVIMVNGKPKPIGPAKSFWQGERFGGMVHGVRTHPATRDMAKNLYIVRGVKSNDASIWNAIQYDDVLAAGLARLLLWTDTFPLPELGDSHKAWELYLRTWRPGKPHPAVWEEYYGQALEYVYEARPPQS